MSGSNIADRHLWLTEDGKVVEADDPAARFLLAAPGDEIPEGHKAPSKSARATEDKAVHEVEDKSVKAPARKG